MKRLIMPKVSFSLLRKTLLAVLIISFCFSLGYVFGLKGYLVSVNKFPNVVISREAPPDKKDLEFSLFWKIWDTLEAKYFDKERLIPAKMVYGAIQGMVAAIGDPYTIFLPPDENKVVEEDLSGSFSGVGIQIGFKGTQLAVVSPLPNSPAEKKGVQAGDFIIGIKDELKSVDRSTVGINLPDAVQLIRGPVGTTVTLTLLRKGQDQPIVVDIKRENIEVPSVTLTFVGEKKDIAQIKVNKFSQDTQKGWDKAVIDILKNPDLKGIIIDLRNNPGGYLQGAVDLSSDFLETGEVVVIEEQAGGVKDEFKVEKLGRLRGRKVVVLINKGSASASEIMAGALRDQAKTRLIGETSFGKGTIQEPEQLDGGAGLHITIAKWLTPKGYWVDQKGLDPDIKVEDNKDTPEDEQLQEAIKVVSE